MVTSGAELVSLLIGPVALQIIVALLAYLWVRSADTALRRADRAEEIARLEHAGAEQRRQLAEGIQQILQTHVRFANGDLSIRAPASQDGVLWQVSVALNNLLARYQRLAQEDGFSRMALEQATQARLALRQWQAGREPVWPQPVGGPLDPLFADLRFVFGHLPSPSAMSAPYAGSGATGQPARSTPTSGPSELGYSGAFGARSGPSQPIRDPRATGSPFAAGPQPGPQSGGWRTGAPDGGSWSTGAIQRRPPGE